MRTAIVMLGMLAGGCVEPEQYGGPIAIEKHGVAARFEMVCGLNPQAVCGARGDEGRTLDDGGFDGGDAEAEGGADK